MLDVNEINDQVKQELEEVALEMRRKKMTRKDLSEASGFTRYQIRRMFKGIINLKELAQIKTTVFS